MHKTFDFKKYVEYKVYSVTTIKNGYGFRVLLTFTDESTKTQQHAGFKTKKEANACRDEVIGQLHTGTYIVYGKIRVEDYLIFWLEDIMRPRVSDGTYMSYRNAVRNYIIPQIGKMYMSTLNQGYIRKLYNSVAEKYESVVKITRTIMKTSLDYALNKNVLAMNSAKDISLPKKVKKAEYHVLKIDEKKILTLPQVLKLIEASKETPIHMQILFAALMGLRRSEINGLKYSDVDYIHRTLKVERQLGKKPNSKVEDCAPNMLTKQELKTKTPAGVRELPIPDYVFEAILEERKTYEKNRRRRPKEFRDWNYICCSTYGNPRSKCYHHKYYKDLLKSLDLPDIHFHQLRNTYATILLKNSFNSKGVSHLLGHAKEIISVDVYGDTQKIIEDCLDVLELFIESVIPKEQESQYYDYSDTVEIDLIIEEYFHAA
ncbi:tyrosine-type recombinase/integrase [Blautia glucerasea]|uniref:tyrosine-type recombinase/integrase n=1 Tax=Blautia glucerasea TaxID=536633 RepID=UPI001D06B150|nr:site-specific integrase [Blautia glucerasea]MCB6546135.1 site-specific integrase [Blautia glucerasea]